MVQKSLIVKALKSPNKAFHQGQRFFKDNLKDFIIIITQQDILAEIVNQKEIRVLGMRRTGNHAIINWIQNQHTGKVEFWNDLKVDRNVYRQNYENLRENYPFVKKDCFIRNYEDYTLQEITNWIFESKHDLYFGKSGTKYDVLIIRDPFNLFASRLKKRLQMEKNNQLTENYKFDFLSVRDPHQTLADLWINYAKEYLGETNYLKHNKICINYNQWFADVEYRRQIADKLQMEFSDTGIDKVTSFGGGSSFEGKQFDGKATSMDVLNRWQKVADNPRYRELFNNQKILKYSERIFGHIPGTESLIN
ncbi:MAG: hypothetical protein SWX82_12555 [Cyanobacteriota bacterium]|nr:hypothetical protein [Cyanobacteriota bacterium]